MAIYNICGQPHSGKTTIANHLKNIIKAKHKDRTVFVLDGDELRKIFEDNDYSKEGRENNIKRAYSIATYLNNVDNSDVIIAIVSPFKDLREEFKKKLDVIEIYVHTTNIRGRENFHTRFEPPTSDFIEVDTTDVSEEVTIRVLVHQINETIKKQIK